MISWPLIYMIFISKRHLKWYTQDQTCNLLTSTPSLMAEKVTDILLTMWLESAYIIHQGENIKNSFALTCLMDPLISMITTVIIMRRKLRDLYNVLHHTCAGKLRTKIFSTTTYTQIDYMQKYHAFAKLLCKDMNEYHPHFNFSHT